MAKRKRKKQRQLIIPSAGKNVEFIHRWGEGKTVQPLWERVWLFVIKLNMYLLYNTAIPLRSIYPREMKTCVQRPVRKYLLTLFIMAQNYKLLKCHQLVNG